jgi:hypothetical protein
MSTSSTGFMSTHMPITNQGFLRCPGRMRKINNPTHIFFKCLLILLLKFFPLLSLQFGLLLHLLVCAFRDFCDALVGWEKSLTLHMPVQMLVDSSTKIFPSYVCSLGFYFIFWYVPIFLCHQHICCYEICIPPVTIVTCNGLLMLFVSI